MRAKGSTLVGCPSSITIVYNTIHAHVSTFFLHEAKFSEVSHHISASYETCLFVFERKAGRMRFVLPSQGKSLIVAAGMAALLCSSLVLKTLPAQAREVLSGPSTLPAARAEAGGLALVWVHSDCWADGLLLEQGQSFGAPAALIRPLLDPFMCGPQPRLRSF